MFKLHEQPHVRVCSGCPGCETNLTDHDLEYELELEEMMQERPDGNSGPPQSTVDVWHITELRMVPTPRGKGRPSDTRPREVTTRRPMEYMNQRVTNALTRARSIGAPHHN